MNLWRWVSKGTGVVITVLLALLYRAQRQRDRAEAKAQRKERKANALEAGTEQRRRADEASQQAKEDGDEKVEEARKRARAGSRDHFE
ncbi:hypothetical protein [Thioalkalivibrio sp. ARh3]|uniref:hypothetical protein n=1 Tax=Thioalkalivibrio sp. ARh3 TaxID=1158148 RepID=UPI00036BBD44|nr:hypothetical protein [Thioalkalivibrio sp. ARh3]